MRQLREPANRFSTLKWKSAPAYVDDCLLYIARFCQVAAAAFAVVRFAVGLRRGGVAWRWLYCLRRGVAAFAVVRGGVAFAVAVGVTAHSVALQKF